MYDSLLQVNKNCFRRRSIMKKALVLVLTAALAVGIAGCGKKAESNVEPTPEVTAEATATPEAEEVVDVVAEETEIVADGASPMDTFIGMSQTTFDAMAESLEGIMELTVTGEGNTLKYAMKVLVELGDNADAVKEAVDAQMEAQKASMELMVESMSAAGIEEPLFIVEYTDNNGDLIASYEFK